MSRNFSTMMQEFPDVATYQSYMSIQRAQTLILPAICVMGFFANTLSLMVFLQPCLRRLSCSFYLAAKSASDFVFLATVFIIWLVRVDIHVFNTTGVCQIVVFFSYLTAFISIWLAVVLTVENLLCIWRPWYVQRTCNATSACVLTFSIVAIGIALYQFSLWNNGIGYDKMSSHDSTTDSNLQNIANHSPNATSERFDYRTDSTGEKLEVDLNEDSRTTTLAANPPSSTNSSGLTTTHAKTCMQLEKFEHFIVITTYIDSIITIFLPIVILAVTNSAIAFIAVRSSRRSRTLRKEKAVYQLPERQGASSSRGSASATLEKQASKFLFFVSVTLLVFHFPIHIVRLKMLVFSPSYQDVFLQRIFETLYYTHYAIGFFIYLIYGSNFRRVFISILTRNSY
ncbi:hypothetical protein BgiMline_033102 [Biomphalaria glabrata]|uniref:Uncharacterized protein LOC106066701 n=1 Tax=Biomphalaria glabrata TaxID=6526 RepID=A0A9U8EC57_BIOGL|nr:uncharacterized protein LOC106066701 [Biomphalaria glabrata]KAI8751564.1 somatostatin receptor type 3-like [Biomphalaria glabrata]